MERNIDQILPHLDELLHGEIVPTRGRLDVRALQVLQVFGYEPLRRRD